jgi:hypothetical protein
LFYGYSPSPHLLKPPTIREHAVTRAFCRKKRRTAILAKSPTFALVSGVGKIDSKRLRKQIVLCGTDFPRWILIDIAALWQSSKDFLNSNFFTAIAGACAGAFAGAYGAQRIVARGKEREELLAEIRNTNAATVVALGICNTFLAIKKQHVNRLKETFDKQKTDYRARAHKYRMGELPPGDTAPPLMFDLQVLVLPPFDLPLDTLRHQIFEKISLSNRRALMLVTSLTETVHGLNRELGT